MSVQQHDHSQISIEAIMLPPPPRGMPHPRSEYAKRIHYLATAAPLSIALQNQLIDGAYKRGLELVHTNYDHLSFVQYGRDGIHLYEGYVNDQFVVKGTTVMRGSVSELLGQLRMHSSSTHDCRRRMHAHFLRTFCHSTNLAQITNALNDGLQVHWLALRGDGMHETPLDLVFASHTQQYVYDRSHWRAWTPHDGIHSVREAGTHIWESIDIRSAPLFDGPVTGCHRIHVHASGFIVEKSSSLANHCNVSFILGLHEQLPREWLHELVSGFTKFIRPDAGLLVPQQLWSHADQCHLCFKSFRFFRRRHHCRLCGHAVCSKCSLMVDIEVASPMDDTITEVTTALACFQCSIHAKVSKRMELLSSSGFKRHYQAANLSMSHRSNTASTMSMPRKMTSQLRLAPSQSAKELRRPQAWADEVESTFTIHAPVVAEPHRSNSMPLPSEDNSVVDCDAMYTIHNPTMSMPMRDSQTYQVFSLYSVDAGRLSYQDEEFLDQTRNSSSSQPIRPTNLDDRSQDSFYLTK